jgi:hypothetical protein
MQQIRRLDPAALKQELASRYSGQIVALTGQEARPPAGKIGYWIDPERTVFSRISDTGRRFYVDVEDGRISRHNLEKLAKVF